MRRIVFVGLLSITAGFSAGAQRDSVAMALPSLVASAMRNNTDLRAAAVVPRLAAADVLAARGPFDPSVVLSSDRGTRANDVLGVSPRATQSSLNNAITLGTILPAGSQLALGVSTSHNLSDPYFLSATTPYPTSNATSVSLSLVQPLLRGAGRDGTYGLVDAAGYSADAAERRYDRAADLVVASVERAYWTLRQAEANETILRRSVEASRAIYQRNVALRDRDAATTLDVLTSERGLATRETQLWEATRQRIDAADHLLFLAYGEQARDVRTLSATALRTAADSITPPAVPTVDEAVQLALAQRTDAVAARSDVDASARRAAQAHSQRLPRLDLIASYGYGGTTSGTRLFSYGDSTDVRSSSWRLGLSASLFGRNDAASALDQRAEVTLESARIAQVGVDNAVVADARAAVRGLQTERDRYVRSRDVIRLAEQEYAVAQEGARLGLITTFQLLQYEDALAQARLLDAQARFALEDAGTEYRLAVGTIRTQYGPVARVR